MISGNTYNYVKDEFLCRKLDMLQVVGKKEPITVYELIDRLDAADPKVKEVVDAYNEAYKLYEARDWAQARDRFREAADKYNDPPSVAYAERCAEFVKKPPSKDWNGVFILKNK
jgi:adenylate cyclase